MLESNVIFCAGRWAFLNQSLDIGWIGIDELINHANKRRILIQNKDCIDPHKAKLLIC